MTTTQLTQMALSAIVRCQEHLDIIELADLLCGANSHYLKKNGYDKVKTFGAGKFYSSHKWVLILLQMLEKGVFFVNYENQAKLQLTDLGRQVLNGEIDVDLVLLKEWGLSFTRQGVKIYIDNNVQDAIDWKQVTDLIASEIYWNYKEPKRIDVNNYIPVDSNNRDMVKAKLIAIFKDIYHIEVDGDVLLIPKKVDYDIYGNEVLPLNVSFEEGLEKFRTFVEAKGVYPQMKATNEEAALRKWFREVGHGIIPVTFEQMSVFRKFCEQHPMETKNTTNKYKTTKS